MKKPEKNDYHDLIEKARTEDLGGGDVTGEATVPSGMVGQGEIRFRSAGVVCGLMLVEDILTVYGQTAGVARPTLCNARSDGEFVAAGECVGIIEGSLRTLLACERVVLNFLQRLSGIATQTARYVAEVVDSEAKVCDTRKTTPGWRALEKYAVRCGGGTNHRMGLYDAVLIKDNHLAALSGSDWPTKLIQAIANARGQKPVPAFIEVEVDTLEQLEQVLTLEGVDRILLDNMNCAQLCQAVALRDKMQPGDRRILLEASGGITLKTVGAVGRTGVDLISVGALTHSAASLDIALDLVSTNQAGG